MICLHLTADELGTTPDERLNVLSINIHVHFILNLSVSQSTVGKSITFAPCVCAVTAYIGERREGRVGGCHEGEVGIRGDPAHQFLLFYITRIMMPITDGKVTADGLAGLTIQERTHM